MVDGEQSVPAQMRYVTAVALLSLATLMPSSGGPPAALDATVPAPPASRLSMGIGIGSAAAAMPHPHVALLLGLLSSSRRPGPRSAQTSPSVQPRTMSVYFLLVEILLRATVATLQPVGRARLPAELRRLVFELVRDIKTSPIVETSAGAAVATGESNTLATAITNAQALAKVYEKSPSPAPTAASTLPPLALGTPSSAAPSVAIPPSTPTTASQQQVNFTTNVVLSCRRYLTLAKDAQLATVRPLYTIPSMHPQWALLGAEPDGKPQDSKTAIVPAGMEGLLSPNTLDQQFATTATGSNSPLLGPLTEAAAASGGAAGTPSAGSKDKDGKDKQSVYASNYNGEPAFNEEDMAASVVSGVDTVLLGNLRLAMVLLEADVSLATEIGVPASVTSAASAGVTAPSARKLLSGGGSSAAAAAAAAGSEADREGASGLVPFLWNECLTHGPDVDIVPALEGRPSTSAAGRLIRVVGDSVPLPKCKSGPTRRAAWALLNALTRR